MLYRSTRGKLFFGNYIIAVVFDVDGVLVDVVSWYRKTMCSIASELGLPKRNLMDLYSQIAMGVRPGVGSVEQAVRCAWPHLGEREVMNFRCRFRALEKERVCSAIPDAKALLSHLQPEVLLGVCSANAIEALDHKIVSGVGASLDWFDAINFLGSRYCKPDFRALSAIAADLRIPPSGILYVDDSTSGLELARHAGTRFAAFCGGFEGPTSFLKHGVPSEHIFGSMSEIYRALERVPEGYTPKAFPSLADHSADNALEAGNREDGMWSASVLDDGYANQSVPVDACKTIQNIARRNTPFVTRQRAMRSVATCR